MFKKILVPIDVDYPKTAAAVYRKAAEIAKWSNAEIRLVSVMPGFSMPIVASYVSDEIREQAKKRLQESLENFIRDNCDPGVSYRVRTGKHWEKVIKTADNWGADLIITYHNRHRDMNEMFSSACIWRVSDKANCSVLRLRNVLT
ncbi:MAG: universal stress protein [Thermodesulfobacteriota bacterium]